MPDTPAKKSAEQVTATAKTPFLRGLGRLSWTERKRLFQRQAWVLLILIYSTAAFGRLWPQDFSATSPTIVYIGWTAFLVRTFTFHTGLLLLIVAVFAAITRNRRLLLATLPAITFTVGPALWQHIPKSSPTVTGKTLTVMSVNLLMMNHHTEPIITEIASADPDILLLQEYTNHWHDAMSVTFSERYPYSKHIRLEDAFGTAVYSKRPFKEPVKLYLPLGGSFEPQVRAVIEWEGRNVVLYNIHLLPPVGLEYIKETRRQFADLLRILQEEQAPVIVCGDFNFTKDSAQADRLSSRNITDVHDIAGWGRGATWPNTSFLRRLPGLRLDHIYLTKGLTCVECRTGSGKGSDHRPIVAKIGLLVE